jgi:ribosome-associated protein
MAQNPGDENRPELERDDPDASLGVNRSSTKSSVDPEKSEEARVFAIEAARTLHDDKCEQVIVLDLRGMSQVTEYFVIATGTSERQMKSAGRDVADLGEGMGMAPFRTNLSEDHPTWVIVDLVDVVTHILSEESRRFYDLEMLWGDAPRVDWSREGESPAPGSLGRDRAGIGVTRRPETESDGE